MKEALNRIATAFGLGRKPLSYEEEKHLARHGDIGERTKLAEREDVRPEILYYLAEDPDPQVRRKIAANSSTPVHADLILARDTDDVVRTDLAAKIARVAPGLSANEQEQIRRLTYEVLEILARDQLPRVRRVLAETLKDVADAPPEIIGRLARDTDIEVSGPVLRCSPVLTEDDLLEIIRTCAVAGPLKAISGREQLGERLSEAIVATDDVEAIGVMLANPSAQIREETLDRLIARAPEIESWHEPLARRPKLSPRAVSKIASFVGESLIAVLQKRGDLDPATVEVLKIELSARLERDKGGAGGNGEDAKGETMAEPAIARVRRLFADGELTEECVAQALGSGDRRFVTAALAVLSDLPLSLVEKIGESKSARGITAVCWKAGLSMRFANQLQIRYAMIAPNAAINPAKGDKFPLTPEEMDWQLEFFGSMISNGKSRRRA